MNRPPRIHRVLERVADLPAMPELVSEVLRVTDDPDADMQEVCARIERDPSLTAKILRVSNSPYYGMKRSVGSLQLALVVLGVREIRNIVLGVSLFDSIRDAAAEQCLGEGFWPRSFRTAQICRQLSVRLGYRFEGEDFVCGLLHGLGKMVLCRFLRQDYVNIYRGAENVLELARAEDGYFGFNHADTAAALANKWNLPQTLCDALQLYLPIEGRSLAQAKDPRLAALVRAGWLGTLSEEEYGSEADPVALAAASEEIWSILDGAPEPIPEADREETLRTLAAEADVSEQIVL